MSEEWAVECDGLTRSFGRRAVLRDVSFRVRKGEAFGLLGLNGAGKTTTVRILVTLLRPTAGRVHVAGHDAVRSPLAVRRVIGYVGEESGRLRLDWTVGEYLRYFGTLHRLPRGETVARASALLSRILPQATPATRLDTLSAGMRKRVELVRALLGEPRVLFLDEPTKDLDIPGKQEMWLFLRQLAQVKGMTIVLTSHDALEIATLCDTVCVLRAGEVGHVGPAPDVGVGTEGLAAMGRLLEGPTPR